MSAGAYEGWPTPARDRVERAVTAHGGMERWQKARSLRLSFVRASGLLLWLKGYERTFRAPPEIEVRPHEATTIFHRYPDDEHQGRFVEGSVHIEGLDGVPVLSSAGHRGTFGIASKYRRWKPLDALYFFGYALWHYHVLPFTLGDARFIRLVGDAGIEVEFAASVHTHCRRQCFFFDAEGRIARDDYVADVLGIWARGCHFWQSYREVNGLQIAHERRVSARAFGRPVPLTALSVSLASR